MTSTRNRVTLLRMRMVSAVAMAALLVLAGCSGDSGEDAAFDGDPIEGGTSTASVAPDTTSLDEETDSDEDEPERITLDPEALLEELMDATTVPPDDAAAPGISVPGPGGSAITSFRDGLEQAGLQSDQVDCFVASASETLGMSEGEMDRLVVDDPTNGWLVAAGQAAATDCLPGGLPSGGPGEGIVLPAADQPGDDLGRSRLHQQPLRRHRYRSGEQGLPRLHPAGSDRGARQLGDLGR